MINERVWRNYPAVLGRIPLFLPRKDKRSPIREPLSCPWGTVLFPDVPLAIYDEDVLIAIMNYGKWNAVDGTILYKEHNLNVLARHMRKTPSNMTTVLITESLEALRCLQVKITDASKFSFKGTVFADMQLVNGVVEVVLDDRISKLIGQTRRIDINMRKQLAPTGKALHRFMSCHSINGDFYIGTIHDAVAPCMRADHFKRELMQELEQLKELRFLEHYEIEKHGKVQYTRLASRARTRNIRENIR